MKKILGVLLVSLLFMPFVVNADRIDIDTFYNRKVIEEGEVELNTILKDVPNENVIKYTYDPTMLSITNEMITYRGQNNLDCIKVENGTITLKKGELPVGIDDVGMPYLNLRFTALQEGTTKISIDFGASYIYPSSEIAINVLKAEKQTAPVEENDKAEPEKPVEPEKPAEPEKPKADKNKDLLFFISLGVNILLLAIIITLIVKNKKKKVME